MPSAFCPPLSALCLMSLALCGPLWFYLLFVPDIWCGVVAWFEHVLLPSCVICCHLLLCASCMPSALCPPLSALCLMSLILCGPGGLYHLFVSDIWCCFVAWSSCHWPCVVLVGFTFFLSQTSGVVLGHLVLSVAMCCTLAACCVAHACHT